MFVGLRYLGERGRKWILSSIESRQTLPPEQLIATGVGLNCIHLNNKRLFYFFPLLPPMFNVFANVREAVVLWDRPHAS